MNLREAARQYLEKMEAHTECCGVPLVRAMLEHIEMHAGDTLSLDNEVTLMRDHWQEAEARVKELEAECFKLAAGVCEHRGGNEHGNPLCLKTNTLI